jgi:hypothetical protein
MEKNNDNSDDEMELLDEDEFIYNVKTGKNGEPLVMAGGYHVNSYFLEQGVSPMTTINSQDGGKEKVSSPFEYLVVPAGIFYLNPQDNKKEKDIKYQNHNTISDDLYDKLFSLIQEEPKKTKNKKTRKYRDATESKVDESKSKSKKKTRRHL